MTRPLCPTEEQEQLALADYLDTRGDLLWLHIPNERHAQKPQYIIKFNRLGVKKGAPDVLVFAFHGDQCSFCGASKSSGLAIELKRQHGGRLNEEQAQWLASLADEGWRTAVCHGAGEAIKIIEECYGKPTARTWRDRK